MSHAAVGAAAQAAYSRSRHSVSNCSALLTESQSLIAFDMPGHSALHRCQRGPVIMLQVTGCHRPDRQSLRAGLCRPLM